MDKGTNLRLKLGGRLDINQLETIYENQNIRHPRSCNAHGM